MFGSVAFMIEVFRQVASGRIAVEVECLPVPLGILEHDVSVLIEDVGVRLRTGVIAPAQFRSRDQR